MKQFTIALLFATANARKHHHRHHKPYVPESASINGDKPLYYTVPKDWEGQQVPGQQFERPDTGMDDHTVLKKQQQTLGQYVPESSKLINGDRGLYYTVPGGWSGQQIPGREFERPDTGLDDDTVLKKRQQANQNLNEYVPESSKLINGDKGLYYTVPGGWSGQQIPGREFERPDTGLDDETVLKKKQQQNLGQYVPESSKLINGDRGLYYTVPGGWSGQQIPGREFERPDTGLDDDTVLKKKQQANQNLNAYVPESSKLINGDKGLYYTVPGGWSGQQIPGREFERPDTGLDDETVLKKKQQHLGQYVPESSKLINGDKGLYYTVPGGWSGQQIPGREFERPDTGLDDETVLKKKQH